VTKDTNFKFGVHAPRESSIMTPEILIEKGMWPGSRDPIIFWALNANSSKMAKDTNFKFGKHAPTDSPDMSPEKIWNRGVARVT